MEPEEPTGEILYTQEIDRKTLAEVTREFVWLYAPQNWTLEMATYAKQKIENILLSTNDIAFKREIGI